MNSKTWFWLFALLVVFCGASFFNYLADDLKPFEEDSESVDAFEGHRSGKWPRVRAAHIEQFPTCAACGSVYALNVHHIKPVWLYPKLELEPTNLITLCEEHHYTVGHDADGPFGPQKPNWKSWNPNVRLHAATMREQTR